MPNVMPTAKTPHSRRAPTKSASSTFYSPVGIDITPKKLDFEDDKPTADGIEFAKTPYKPPEKTKKSMKKVTIIGKDDLEKQQKPNIVIPPRFRDKNKIPNTKDHPTKRDVTSYFYNKYTKMRNSITLLCIAALVFASVTLGFSFPVILIALIFTTVSARFIGGYSCALKAGRQNRQEFKLSVLDIIGLGHRDNCDKYVTSEMVASNEKLKFDTTKKHWICTNI